MAAARPLTGPDDPRHGTYAGYQQEYKVGGRAAVCERCREAEVTYQAGVSRQRAYGRPRKVPTEIVAGQLRALMALGWSGEYLAERLGVRRSNMPTSTKYPTVRAPFAQAVQKLYDELCVMEGPSERTRRRAAKAGWHPPTVTSRGISFTPAERPPKPVPPRERDVARRLVRRALTLGTPLSVLQRYLGIDSTAFEELVLEVQKEIS